jgi:diguanylate cyclase (GGDEF)-like protein
LAYRLRPRDRYNITMPNEPSAIEDYIVELLTTLGRALGRTVSVAFVVSDERGSWTAPRRDELATATATLARESLERGGPWGLVRPDGVDGAPGIDGADVWLEPIDVPPEPASTDKDGPAGSRPPAVVGSRNGSSTAGSGALGVTRRHGATASSGFSAAQIDAVRMVARICASTIDVADMTRTLEHQREIEQLVAQVAERLMSTTWETMQSSLDWTVEALALYLGADFAFLRRNDHANGVSVLLAEYPPRDAPDPDPLAVVPFDSDPIFAASRDFKVPMLMRSPEGVDTTYMNRVEEASGISDFAGAGVPLVYGDVTEGVLAFVRLSRLDWAEHELSALRMVASLLVHLTHRLEMAENWRRRALTDELTGLPNRRALLAEADRRRPTQAMPLELIFLDLDRFKVMNDYLGHGVGDKVLATIADRIRDSIRPTDFAARLGGDEFVILLGPNDAGVTVVDVAKDLLEVISQPTVIDGMEIVHSGSIGIAISAEPGHTAEELLGQADIALYAAKRRGRNRLVVFDGELQAQVAERSDTELSLRQAFADQQHGAGREQLMIYYQPEFDVIDRRMVAVEALVRWNHPSRGLLVAGEFIPVAEETHLMPELGRWVLQQSCAQMAKWQSERPGLDIVLRVNMSPTELAVPGFVGRVKECLEESGLPGQTLCLEITENTAIINVEQTVRMLHELRALGVQLAIDDFGSGYSSMIQLKNLPVNVLKIDRVFVDGVATDDVNQAIVESIVRIGAAFELEVVAEGIERPEDMEALVRLGCRRSQGFLLAPPLPPERVEEFMDEGNVDFPEVSDLRQTTAAGRSSPTAGWTP